MRKRLGSSRKLKEAPAKAEGSLTTEKLLWTYQDLADRTSFAKNTLEKWVHYGRLGYPAVLKIGRSVRFDPEQVIARLRELGAE